jgi:hypothetical protein
MNNKENKKKTKKKIYEENTTRYIKYASTAKVQTAETHVISDVKENGTILQHKFNTRLVPNIISVPGLLVTFTLFKPYESAIIKLEVFFNTCARTNIISCLDLM